ncbi:hypothetical protein DPMN_146354 [Dreissena polymorpha]|uniref:Uncharacterized protein n=1 Tax=Dreissena polymorpha TaxID=45954 RepID=A0A9D4FA60_DREPO|nr:hypothetical protein DPMN_146354 [Dreissena polymorpha]
MPSDTEDKQAETFSEFDDMSSMAEPGGSNLDDVRSEPGGSNLDDLRSEPDVGMINENPPIASGVMQIIMTVKSQLFLAPRLLLREVFYVPHYSSGGHIVFALSVGWLVCWFAPTLTFAITFAILKIAT